MRRLLLLLLSTTLFTSYAFCQTGHFISSDRFSSGLISSICQDKYGSIWVGTDYGLNRYDGYQFHTFLHHDDDPWSIQANGVVSLLCDDEGRVWVGTTYGLDCYDEAADGFVHYDFPEGRHPRVSALLQLHSGEILVATAGYGAYLVGDDQRLRLATGLAEGEHNNYFSRVFEDSQHRFWKTGSDNTIVMKSGSRFQLFQSKGDPQGIVERDGEVLIVGTRGIVSYRQGRFEADAYDLGELSGKEIMLSTVTQDAQGHVYIGTRGHGLFRIAKGSRRLERYEASLYGVSLNTATVKSILPDRHGNLWVGLQRKGLALIPQHPMQFANWSFESQKVSLGAPVTSVCEGDGGVVWCSVQGTGIYGFDQQGRIVAHPSAPDAVEFIFRDRQRRYWIGTDDALFAYDPLTGRAEQRVTFVCDKFNDMTSDAQGNIYISAFSRGLCVYNPATGTLDNYRNEGHDTLKTGHLCNDWILSMTVATDGTVWMGTSSGVSCFDPRSRTFVSKGWNQLLGGIMCFSVCELADGRIAIGTDRGLYVYDHQRRETTLFPGSDQLRNKMVNYIVQSADGDLWCSTSMGIWQYDQSAKTFVGHVNGNGLVTKEYLYGVGMHTAADLVCFGHNDGFTVFYPRRVNTSHPTLAPTCKARSSPSLCRWAMPTSRQKR